MRFMGWFRNKYSLVSRLALYTDVANELKKREAKAPAEKIALESKENIINGMIKAAKRGDHQYTGVIYCKFEETEFVINALCKMEEFKGIRISHKEAGYYGRPFQVVDFNWYGRL